MSAGTTPQKLVLCVIDAMAPEMLVRAADSGAAPVLATMMQRGTYVADCVAAFPSVTPVCAAAIVTGTAQDQHLIPGMNWYSREESRYVEYGSSLRAAQRFGIARQLTDLIYNMNRAHLASETATLFELLDDAQLRTACTTYLMYRGRHLHEPQRDTALTRFAASTIMRHPVMGPRELFYADIFASRSTGCHSTLGLPGVRDRHSGCVGAYLVEHDLFDFLLLSLPDNDWLSHKGGPDSQLRSIAAADLQLARVAEAAGGIDEFLSGHAVVVMADHSQVPVRATIDLQADLSELGVRQPDHPALLAGIRPSSRSRADVEERIAVCPSQRAAMVYALRPDERDAMRASVIARAMSIEGVDLVAWLAHDAHDAPVEAVVSSPERGELRFAPGGNLRDARGTAWSIEGDLPVIDCQTVPDEGLVLTEAYPDALARLWSALTCPTSGEVLISAGAGHEFVDWGGAAHVGGGSHGSLHRDDSLAPLVLCGLDPPADAPRQWAIRDVASLILGHFGLQPSAAAARSAARS
ncbi:MAG TPA: alkaline phosphatase family protein [Solirubrobacteraceae bacterium]|nr:alkaline phosphatase family protein [Solirubrobacteraceae bacterium]